MQANIAKLINEQINAEFYSAYLYLTFADYYEEQLRQAAKEEGYAVGRILRSPIDGLVEMEQLG